jgi:hypothetical protein
LLVVFLGPFWSSTTGSCRFQANQYAPPVNRRSAIVTAKSLGKPNGASQSATQPEPIFFGQGEVVVPSKEAGGDRQSDHTQGAA